MLYEVITTEVLQAQSDKNDLASAAPEKKSKEQQLKSWRWIWLIPAIFAAAVMGGFFYTFNESENIDSGETTADDVANLLGLGRIVRVVIQTAGRSLGPGVSRARLPTVTHCRSTSCWRTAT